MTTNYHTPLNATDMNNMAKLNSIFASLDAGITGGSVTGTAGETLSVRDFVYLASDGSWYKIDTDAVSSVAIGAVRGCVSEDGGISSAASGQIQLGGSVAGFTGLSNGGAVYAGTSAGGYTQTRPVVSDGGGQIAIVEMGFAISTTEVYISPRPVIYAERETLADDGTLTIEHHSDPSTRLRDVMAYVATTIAGASLASYASGNQDSDVALRDRSVDTYTADQCTGGTASASSEFSGSYPASEAFDDTAGTSSNRWVSTNSSAPPHWLEYDFGTDKTIRRYTIDSPDEGDGTIDSPTTWELQYYDGATWQTADSRTGHTDWATVQTFDVAGAYTAERWRLYVTANINSDNGTSIGEMQMMEASTFTDGDDKLAQSFEVTGTQTVASVDLRLKKTGGPGGTMTLRIETDNSGEPSGTLADANLTTTLAESGLGSSYADATFTFSTPASISGSTTYWLVLSTDRSASETNYVAWGADGSTPSYADGAMMSEASSSWSAESKDAVFEVFGEGTTYDEPLGIGSVSGASEEIGVRYDDGAGSDGDTKTTFKNLTGASADIVCEVVL
jgi:hypothetical protein